MIPSRPFMDAVYAVVQLVPRGRVASYGQVATFVVSPRHARAIGAALKHLPEELSKVVPWHRIINSGGSISHRGDGGRPSLQRQLLEAEGVIFSPAGRVSWKTFGWDGPPDDWEPPFPYPFPIGGRAERLRGGWIVGSTE